MLRDGVPPNLLPFSLPTRFREGSTCFKLPSSLIPSLVLGERWGTAPGQAGPALAWGLGTPPPPRACTGCACAS